ncbi:MobA/MobL family protein, partial [Neoasaia chiangmaiensis]
VAIHAPGREGDNRNHHAHILTTTRTVTATSLGVKTRVLDSKQTGRAEIEHLRSVWASQVNAALERHQVEERVDHRSFARREIAKVATVHVGVHAAAIERKAKREAEAESRPYEPVTNRVRHNAKFMEGARLAL